MSSAEHVFDAIVLAPIDGELPKLIYRAQGIVAKDEDAAKLKAVDEARAVTYRGIELDLDAIEVLVTRPFVDEDMVLVTWSGYVAAREYFFPVLAPRYCNSKSTADVKVTTGSTFDGG